MKRQARRSTAINPKSDVHWFGKVVSTANYPIPSNTVTDIALSWIKERAEKQHATYKPGDLNLREAWAEYLSYQHGEHWTPRHSYLVRRISALLG